MSSCMLHLTNLFAPSYSTMIIKCYDLITRHKIANQEWNDNVIYDMQSSNDSESMTTLRMSNMTIAWKTMCFYQ